MSEHPRVLIINDSQSERNDIRRSIEGICDVIAPETHDDLLQRLAEGLHTYAVIILDYVFEYWNPQRSPKNGREVLERLSQDRENRQPDIILLTKFPPKDSEIKELKQAYHLYVFDYGQTTPRQLKQELYTLFQRPKRDREETH